MSGKSQTGIRGIGVRILTEVRIPNFRAAASGRSPLPLNVQHELVSRLPLAARRFYAVLRVRPLIRFQLGSAAATAHERRALPSPLESTAAAFEGGGGGGAE